MMVLLGFALLLGLLYITKQWVQRMLSGIVLLLGGSTSGAIKLYTLIFLPGVIIHELSHFTLAAMTGVPTGDITLFPHSIDKEEKRLALGSVKIARTDFIRSTIIGAAPLMVGISALFALSAFYLGKKVLLLDAYSLQEVWRAFVTQPGWLTIIILYLMWGISNTLFVSKEDTRQWPLFLVFISLVWICISVSSARSTAINKLFFVLEYSLSHILAGLFFGLLLNCVVLLGLFLILTALERITRKRISYR